MGTKLAKDTYPENGTASAFQCFGPPSTRDGEFGGIRPVRHEGRTQHVDFRMRLDPRLRF